MKALTFQMYKKKSTINKSCFYVAGIKGNKARRRRENQSETKKNSHNIRQNEAEA